VTRARGFGRSRSELDPDFFVEGPDRRADRERDDPHNDRCGSNCARPSARALRRPSRPSVVPRPPRMIGPLRKNTTTAAMPRRLDTSPTFAGRFRAPVSLHDQRPTSAKSATVRRITIGTRMTPSRSWGTKNQRSRHHDSSLSRIPWIRGKKIAARAVTIAPAQSRVVFPEEPSNDRMPRTLLPLRRPAGGDRRRPYAASGRAPLWPQPPATSS